MPYTREGNNFLPDFSDVVSGSSTSRKKKGFWDALKEEAERVRQQEEARQQDETDEFNLDPEENLSHLKEGINKTFTYPKSQVDRFASYMSDLPETIPTEKLISESLFPRENEEENTFSKALKYASPYGALLDMPHVEAGARSLSKIPAALATDPMSALGGMGRIPQALMGAYFGSQAASEGGKELGEAASLGLDQGQGLSPEVVEKLVGGVGQLGFAGAAFGHPIAREGLNLAEKLPELGLDKPITGPGTERGAIEFGGSDKPLKNPKAGDLFDQTDIDRRALELVDQGYKPERAIKIAKAEFEELAAEQAVIPQKAQKPIEENLGFEIPGEEKLSPEVIDLTDLEQQALPKPDAELKQRVSETRNAEKLQKQLEREIAKEQVSKANETSQIKSLDNPSERSFIDDLTDLPKTMRGSIDVSYPFRQGLFFLNRPEARAGLLKGLKSVKESSHLATQADLASRPNAELYKNSGLELTKYDPTEIHEMSEQTPSKLAEKIPGMKQSQRAFIDQGNLTMANMFDKFTNDFQKQGKTFETHPDLYKGTAKYINVLTGRDTLPQKLQQAHKIMNKAFWSPRFVKSRMQLLNPLFYKNLPKEIQIAAIRDVGGTLATLTSALGVAAYAAKQAGAKDVSVESDPRHTEFGKLRVGKTTYDFSGGLAPLIRTASRVATGEAITPGQGKRKLRGMSGRNLLGLQESEAPEAPFGRSTLAEITGFGEGKLSPLVSAGGSLIKGTGFGGEKYGPGQFARDTLAPMGLTSFIENYKRYGLDEALKALPDMVGVGTNTDLPPELKGNYWEESGGKSSATKSSSTKKKKKKSSGPKFLY